MDSLLKVTNAFSETEAKGIRSNLFLYITSISFIWNSVKLFLNVIVPLKYLTFELVCKIIDSLQLFQHIKNNRLLNTLLLVTCGYHHSCLLQLKWPKV